MKLREWYAVHSKTDATPSPATWLESVQPQVAGLMPDFEIHDGKWKEGSFRLESLAGPVVLASRVLPGEDAFLWDGSDWETGLRKWGEPNCDYVIQHVRNVKQTFFVTPIHFTLSPFRLARVCEQLCGYLARVTDGVIHVYQEGFFNSKGKSLLPCCPQHRLRTW